MKKKLRIILIIFLILILLFIILVLIQRIRPSIEEKNEECIRAGEFANYLNPTVPQNICCEGLIEISGGINYEPSNPSSNEEGCVFLLGAGTICSDCGNGNCESWENKCNCPQDC